MPSSRSAATSPRGTLVAQVAPDPRRVGEQHHAASPGPVSGRCRVELGQVGLHRIVRWIRRARRAGDSGGGAGEPGSTTPCRRWLSAVIGSAGTANHPARFPGSLRRAVGLAELDLARMPRPAHGAAGSRWAVIASFTRRVTRRKVALRVSQSLSGAAGGPGPPPVVETTALTSGGDGVGTPRPRSARDHGCAADPG